MQRRMPVTPAHLTPAAGGDPPDPTDQPDHVVMVVPLWQGIMAATDFRPAIQRENGRTMLRDFFETAKDQQKTNLWAVTNSTRDLPFFVSLKGQTVAVTARRGTSVEPLAGTLAAVVYQGGDQNAGVAGVVIEEPVQSDGTAQAHYVPIDALTLVSFRVLKRPG
jgi:hypothetical protein